MAYLFNEEYFTKYIDNEYKRIDRFKIIEEKCENDSQKQMCYHTIALFYKNIIYCLYSLRKKKEEFTNVAKEFISYSSKTQNTLPESEKLDLIAIEYLFIESKEETYQAMIKKLESNSDEKVYKELLIIAKSNNIEVNLKDFMTNKWYDMCKDFPWYNSHNNDNGTFVGYCSFIATAIAKRNNINTQNIKYTIK